MLKFVKRVLALIVFIVLGVTGVLMFGPRERPSSEIAFDPDQIGTDLDAYLRDAEALYPQITEGVQKQIIWAGDVGARTKDVIVYIHGFSSTSQEIRPVPDQVAANLGANLYLPRLTGHGLPGSAMGGTHVDDWMVDLAETMEIARRLGDRVILMTTSTGGTLTAVGLDYPEVMKGVEGIIFVSPNFGVHNPLSALGRLPFGRVWFSWLAGKERSWEPMNDLQAKYWTTSYPPHAIIPMMSLIAHTEKQDFTTTKLPALFYFTDRDMVVDPVMIRQVMGEWGGAVTQINPQLGDKVDGSYHVIAGDIVSPSQTAPATAAMTDWILGLN